MSKTIGDLTLNEIKEIKEQCKNCEFSKEVAKQCREKHPKLYALCDIYVDDEDLKINITDEDFKEVEDNE